MTTHEKGSTPMRRPRTLVPVTLAAMLLVPLGTAVAEETPSSSPTPNQPPVAVPDEAAVDAGAARTVDVLANDEDDRASCPTPDASCLTLVAVSGGGGDRVTWTPEGQVTFAARSGDDGPFTLTYVVSDGELTDDGQLVVRVTGSPTRRVGIAMADRPVALRTYPISGRARPLSAGPAVVRVQRRAPSGWVGVGRDRTDAEGRYSVPFGTDKTGERRFRAVAEWATGPRVRSDVITRTVRAVADPQVSGPLTAADVPFSWRAGCPVPPSDLRKIRINRLDYKGRIARGTIVARAGEVGALVKVFTGALNNRFPVRSMKPADHYYDGGRRTPMESDKAAMRAGNTSAFNCRPVTGNPYRVSQHSYGNAVDINTIENPYVTGSQVYPSGSREYLDRSPYRRGMILRGGVVAERMRSLGWLWGARWAHPDYQHFSSNGG